MSHIGHRCAPIKHLESASSAGPLCGLFQTQQSFELLPAAEKSNGKGDDQTGVSCIYFDPVKLLVFFEYRLVMSNRCINRHVDRVR